MYATDQARQAAVDNARRWVATQEPHLRSYLNVLITQESGWRPDLESGTGARGLTQFTRGTWKDTVSWLRKNADTVQLPPGVTIDGIENYDQNWSKPLASAFMARANIGRLEDAVLPTVNSRRRSDGLDNAGNLLDAVDGDPRKWAFVVGAGHKDGQARQKRFFNDAGRFDFDPAIEFYQEMRTNNRAEAAKIKPQLDAARKAGNTSQVEKLSKRYRFLTSGDSDGHVFGYGDRIASGVAASAGAPALEMTREQAQAMYDLRIPTHSDSNPTVIRFRERLDTGVATVESTASSRGAITSTPPQISFFNQGPTNADPTIDDIATRTVRQVPDDPPPGFAPVIDDVAAARGAAARASVGEGVDRASELGRSARAGVASAAERAAEILDEQRDRFAINARETLLEREKEELQTPRSAADRFLGEFFGYANPEAVQARIDEIDGELDFLRGVERPANVARRNDVPPNPITSGPQNRRAPGGDGAAQPGVTTPSQFPELEAPPNQDPEGFFSLDGFGAEFDRSRRGIFEPDPNIAVLDAQAQDLNARADERLAIENAQRAALLGLEGLRDINLPSSRNALSAITNNLAPNGIVPQGSAPDFAEFDQTINVPGPDLDQLAGVGNFIDGNTTGAFQRSARNNILGEIAFNDPARFDNIVTQQEAQGIDPFRGFDDNVALQEELIRRERIPETRAAEREVTQILENPANSPFILSSPQIVPLLRDIAATRIGALNDDFRFRR